MSDLGKMAAEIHATARKNGFWDDYLETQARLRDVMDDAAQVVTITRESDDPSMKANHEYAVKSYKNALERQGREQFNFYAKQIAMIHSEATELLEALRKDKGKLEVEAETADIIIRVLDLYEQLRRDGYAELDIEEVVWRKMGKNQDRERLHGVKG